MFSLCKDFLEIFNFASSTTMQIESLRTLADWGPNFNEG